MSDLVGNPEDRFSRVEVHLIFVENTHFCKKDRFEMKTGE